MKSSTKLISVGARSSPLSQTQVKEVLEELRRHHPEIEFQSTFLASQGDKDLKTSLRTLNKTDFFSKEIDELVLKGQCRIGIHSAKDLPDPLPEGLTMVALTHGIDPADMLVLRAGETLTSLPAGAIIATSSERREEAVLQMRPDLRFIDLRGNIGQRLAKLESGEADGVVVAEAALIRLGLTHLNRLRIPGETAQFQGQLAVIAREDDPEMRELFASIDCRGKKNKTILYLGLDYPKSLQNACVIHYPIIKTLAKPFEDSEIQRVFDLLPQFTHILFTSKTAVKIFFEYLQRKGLALNDQTLIATGKATAGKIEEFHYQARIIAKEESGEGIIKELESLDLRNAYLLWPHSALSRRILPEYFQKRGVRFHECEFYDTLPNKTAPVPCLAAVDEIIFTSPSCIDAFLDIFRFIPADKTLTCIGPVTEAHLKKRTKRTMRT